MGFWNVCKIVSIVLGPILIILGACLNWVIFPAVVDSTVKSTLQLKESNTETWDSWKEPPITPYMKFTFFQVENPQEVEAGEKPRVKEVGDFAYKEVRRKENIHSIFDEISYGSYIHYEFDAAASGEDAKDPHKEITVINPVLAIVNALIVELRETLKETVGGIIHKVCSIPEGHYKVKINCDNFPIANLKPLCPSLLDADGFLPFEYKDGKFILKISILPDPYELPCVETLESITIDDVKGIDNIIWTSYVEKIILNKLANLVNCDSKSSTTKTVTSSSTTSTPPLDCYNIDYENVPKECFCDGLTMTDVPDRMIFTGAHSGILLALHNVLEHIDINIKIPEIINVLHLPEMELKDINIAAIIDKMLENMGLSLLDLKHGKFGFFRGPGGTNATKTWWKINSGKYQMEFYNKVLEFNGQSKLPDSWWQTFGPTPSSHRSGVPGVCHEITGTDGLSFPPSVSKEEDVWIFNDQLCRSIWLSYVDEVDVMGVNAYQFSPKDEVFSMENPNNYCYCPKVEKCAIPMVEGDKWDMSLCRNRTVRGIGACTDGILNLQGCQGAPVIMSTPHFLGGDPVLVQAIEGLKPDKEKHTTYLNLEPTTGLPIVAHKRIQVSVPLLRSDYFTALKKVQETVFPVVWVDEGADLDDENADKLKSMLVTPFLAVNIGSGFIIAIGGILIILAAGLAFFCKGR